MIGNNCHLKNRFPEKIIELLLLIKWWDMPYDWIATNIQILAKNPTIENLTELREMMTKH